MPDERIAKDGADDSLPGIALPGSAIPETGRTVIPDRPGLPGEDENAELEWGRRNVNDDPAPELAHDVFRKTELHAVPPDTGSDDLKKLMNQMMKRLKNRDPEILYLQYETSFREFICSLMVRQYREEKMQREQVAALWDQIGLLDDRLERGLDRLERLIHETSERRRS